MMLLYECLNPICFMFFIRNFFIKEIIGKEENCIPNSQLKPQNTGVWSLSWLLTFYQCYRILCKFSELSLLLYSHSSGQGVIFCYKWLSGFISLSTTVSFLLPSNFCHLFPFWSLYCALGLLVTTKAHLTSRLRPLRTKMC